MFLSTSYGIELIFLHCVLIWSKKRSKKYKDLSPMDLFHFSQAFSAMLIGKIITNLFSFSSRF